MQAATPAPALRPLGVGDILDRVFNLYRGRPLLFLALAAIPYFVFVLVLGVLLLIGAAGALATFGTRLFSGTQPTPAEIAGIIGAAFVFGLIILIAAIVIFSTQSGALIQASADRYLGRETTIGAAFRAGLRAAPRIFGAGLLVFLGLAILWIVLLAIAGVLTAVTQQTAVGVLAFVAASCIGLVVTIYLAASWLVAPVVVTLEGVGPTTALDRSWKLADGHRWRILGIQLLLLVLQLVLSGLISALFIVGLSQDQTVQVIVQQLVNFAANIVWAPIQWAAFTVFYYDLRVRKEAFDLQVAAEALPTST
ncbi:MAG: hypothetical protein AUG02_05990 [Chloroflexi bacterium 13_1_20CM_2_70_9]|nr:MAG: hypothetical protein AUG02_05990 [Chloroflexi bacterium 13_1_20CM_2_70_9]